ncbi:MAG: hypothetical protein K2H38_13240 [Muribaculaceae bacterium]|nr:hypothetical protein [Muribaculaceae bacterium]
MTFCHTTINAPTNASACPSVSIEAHTRPLATCPSCANMRPEQSGYAALRPTRALCITILFRRIRLPNGKEVPNRPMQSRYVRIDRGAPLPDTVGYDENDDNADNTDNVANHPALTQSIDLWAGDMTVFIALYSPRHRWRGKLKRAACGFPTTCLRVFL